MHVKWEKRLLEMFKCWSEVFNQILPRESEVCLALPMICFDDSSSARTPLYQNKHNLNDGLKPPSTNPVCISDLST